MFIILHQDGMHHLAIVLKLVGVPCREGDIAMASNKVPCVQTVSDNARDCVSYRVAAAVAHGAGSAL